MRVTVEMIDAAMAEMRGMSPPITRDICHRVIRAALDYNLPEARNCHTCKHTDVSPLREPCKACTRERIAHTLWEPGVGSGQPTKAEAESNALADAAGIVRAHGHHELGETLETLAQFRRDGTKDWPQWMQDAARVASASFPHPGLSGHEEFRKQWLTEEKPVPRECYTCWHSDSYGTAACSQSVQSQCGTEKTLWVPLNPPKGGLK